MTEQDNHEERFGRRGGRRGRMEAQPEFAHPGRGHAEHGCGHHHHHHHHPRNFWREWRAERPHFWRGGEYAPGQPPSPQDVEAWREFFRQNFGNWPEGHWIFGGRRFSPWRQGMDTFNPFVATLLSKGGGLLPLYVLHLIAQEPRYGNAIMDLLAERTNGQWVANPGAVYPLLTQLEREGFIEGRWEDPDKRTVRVYTITAAGQAEVERIEMIVMPKLTETVQVLQGLIEDLQGQPGGDAEADETGETGEPDGPGGPGGDEPR